MMKSPPPQPVLFPLATEVQAQLAEDYSRRVSTSATARPSEVADALLASRIARGRATAAAQRRATEARNDAMRRQSDAFWAERSAARKRRRRHGCCVVM